MLSAAAPIAGPRGSLAAYFDVSRELLRTIANVLDVRPVLPQISDSVSRILPHDALALVALGGDGQIGIEAATGDLPAMQPPRFRTPVAEGLIIGDLTSEPLPVVSGTDPTPRLVASGYRSLLDVSTRSRHGVVRLAFWSKQRHTYGQGDLPMARRIADHIAVAVSHERMSRAECHTSSGGAGGARVDDTVRSVCAEVHRKSRMPIVGQSAEWREALRKAAQVAPSDTTVLVTGESGTGKEVVARFLHEASARRSGPFVALNCAALPEQLLEAELFGYERGAFTSAQQAKPGQIELAAGGVLLLDEVSEMSRSAQAKFLRVLQEREFQRLGGTRLLKANIRVVAATNRDLRTAVEQGDFREDLFYRLQVFDIHIPPLRERRADILPLSEAFLQEFGRSFAGLPAALSDEAREALLHYDWPGNVRELRNALERAAILCEDGRITREQLSLDSVARPACTPRSDTTTLGTMGRSHTTHLGTMEREMIAKVLRDCWWNKSAAARRLGLSRTQLYVRMRRYQLDEAATA